uniref:DUF4939 domain-containing protein n=1 Tax=Anolis carolinensis TaxID=28377 RepID=A0A803TCZ7_ANOCA
MDELRAKVDQLQTAFTVSQTAQAVKGHVLTPERFDGTRCKLPTFLAQVELYFSQLSAHAFPTDTSKVAFILSLLTGPAGQWATNLILGNDPVKDNLNNFKKFQLRGGSMFSYPLHYLLGEGNLFLLWHCWTQGLRSPM